MRVDCRTEILPVVGLVDPFLESEALGQAQLVAFEMDISFPAGGGTVDRA